MPMSVVSLLTLRVILLKRGGIFTCGNRFEGLELQQCVWLQRVTSVAVCGANDNECGLA